MPSIQGGAVEVVQEEPLKRELVDFIDAVHCRSGPCGIRSGRPPRARARDPDRREDVFVLCIATLPSSLPIWTKDGSFSESPIA